MASWEQATLIVQLALCFSTGAVKWCNVVRMYVFLISQHALWPWHFPYILYVDVAGGPVLSPLVLGDKDGTGPSHTGKHP